MCIRDRPNATFLVPVVAGQPFTLSFINPTTGTVAGTSNGQAPTDSAEVDLGEPLGTTAGQLLVSAQPDANAIVDINDRLVFTFSEPIDSRTVDTSLLVTDAAGKRVFGSVAVSSDATRVTFTPSRRWPGTLGGGYSRQEIYHYITALRFRWSAT